MLGALTPEQVEAKAYIENYLKMPAKIKKPTIQAFIAPKELTLELILSTLVEKPRLKRAQRIRDDELHIQKVTANRIEESVRNYHIVIDRTNHIILHDCADWSNVLPRKQFCKHLGKLILSLDRKKATNILHQILSERDIWQFKPYTG